MRREDARVFSEDELIANIVASVGGGAAQRRVLNGIGDDAAVWQPSRSHRSIITADAMIEGVHFTRELMTLHDAGYRAMASNLSDAAASGARPVLATVTLGIPADTAQDEVLEIMRGIAECAGANDCAIAGGDCTRAPALCIAISLVGEVRASNVKGRAGARPGDVVAVTGALGASRAGLFHADGRVTLDEPNASRALLAFRRPQARVAYGKWLAASSNVHAIMDISDGLSTDLLRLCARSQCAAVIDDVPVAPAAIEAAQKIGEDPCAFALAGGEDYELLIAVSPRAFAHVAHRFHAHFRTELHRVGTFREGTGAVLRNGAVETPLAASGFDHFTRR